MNWTGVKWGCCGNAVFSALSSQRFAESWCLQWAAGGILSSKAQGLSRDSGSLSRPLTLSIPLEAVRPEKADSRAPGQGGQFWKGISSRRPHRGRTAGVEGRGPRRGMSAHWHLPAGPGSRSCSPPVKITGGQRAGTGARGKKKPWHTGPGTWTSRPDEHFPGSGRWQPQLGCGQAAPGPLSGLLLRR